MELYPDFVSRCVICGADIRRSGNPDEGMCLDCTCKAQLDIHRERRLGRFAALALIAAAVLGGRNQGDNDG